MAEEGLKIYRIKPSDDIVKARLSLEQVERQQRRFRDAEVVPYAKGGTSFVEMAETVFPDSPAPYSHPLYLLTSRHPTTIGISALAKKTMEFLEGKKREFRMDILSVSAGIDGDQLMAMALVRVYEKDGNGKDKKPKMSELSEYLGKKKEAVRQYKGPRRLYPPWATYSPVTKEQREAHRKALEQQRSLMADDDVPFLNRIEEYVPQEIYDIDPRTPLVYDIRTRDMQIELNTDYETFISVFGQCMRYITSTEKDKYYEVLKSLASRAMGGEAEKKSFYGDVEAYVQRTFVDTRRLPKEDVAALMAKIEHALFELYIVQDLVDDPAVSDIYITNPYDIGVRIKGKTYRSNIMFIDGDDYMRFINGIAVTNGIDLRQPTQTFVDDKNEDYKLRFYIASPYITPGYPIVTIRKVPKKKMMDDDLFREGMFNEVVRDCLKDCALHSKGVVFGGATGSGKTTILNWFLEQYESTASILAIEENPELVPYRPGVMLEHVVEHVALSPHMRQAPVTLEKLGQMALVASANVFVIGEVKGSEINHAITLSNSGCRTAMTIHSDSARETIEKMVNLVVKSQPNLTYDQAKRQLTSFDTFVYLSEFKVQEITRVKGYDEQKKDLIYENWYRREDA